MTCRYSRIAFIAAVAASSAWGQSYTISTYAGNGATGYAGDGSAIGTAQFSVLGGIVVDSAGNVYISDSGNNRVRKVSGGNINTFAGDGTAGDTGDKAAATSAEINKPAGLALDSSGNLYIADYGNHVIRMVSPSGTITTVAGNGTEGYEGDGGTAITAELDSPTSVAVDSSGNLYIADSLNKLIRKVTASTGIITTVVGSSGTSGLMVNPVSVALDAAGNVYIADNEGERVFKFNGATLTAIAGNGTAGFSGDNGPAAEAALDSPSAVMVDRAGNIYISDRNNGRIRKINTAGIITTIAGSGSFMYVGDGGPATHAGLDPDQIAMDSAGNIYVADTSAPPLSQPGADVRLLQPVFPVISSGGVGNAASGAPQISPGALASVYGSNFASANLSATVTANAFPTTVGGVSVTVNGQAAPITFAGTGQVNFQVPWGIGPGTATIVVSVNGGASNSLTVPVTAAGPGIFVSGSGQAIAANADYTLNSPSNPAAAGSTIVVYVTGSGPVTNQPATGAVTPVPPQGPLSYATLPVSATIGSANAQVAFLGLAPAFFGVVQANITVPSGLAPGNYPLVVTIGSDTSNAATISVK